MKLIVEPTEFACIHDRVLHCVKHAQIRSFLWSVISRIRTEYGEILCIYPYSVQMRENTDQKKLHIWALPSERVSITTPAKGPSK